MKLGKKVLEALQAEIDGQLNPGDELIVAGPVAAEGTAWITENNYEAERSFCRTVSGGCQKTSGRLRYRNGRREQ